MPIQSYGLIRALLPATVTILLVISGCSDSSVDSRNNATTTIASDVQLPYRVLRHSDYVQVTGCNVNKNVYNDSLQTALNFLVFRDDHAPNDELLSNSNDEIGYARRHSRGLFGGLLKTDDTGFERIFGWLQKKDEYSIDRVCNHSSLARIGKELGFPEKDGSVQSAWDEGKKSQPSLTDASSAPITEFEILSRPDYMAVTSCLVSPSSFHKYHLAFFQHVLGWGHEDGAAQAAGNMRAFLLDVYAGRHIGEVLNPTCMIPAISILAKDLNLLNKDGQFVYE